MARRHKVRPSERLSAIAQWIIRRWTFVGLYTGGSLYVWYRDGYFTHGFTHALLHDPSLAKWNALASLGALLIESSVGIGMYASQKRDSVMIANTDKIAKRQQQMHGQNTETLHRIEAELLSVKFLTGLILVRLLEEDVYGGLAPETPKGPGGPLDTADGGGGRGESPGPSALPLDGDLRPSDRD